MSMSRSTKIFSWLRSNQGLGSVLTVIFLGLLGYVLLSPWMFIPQRGGFLLGFIPLLAVCLMLLLTLTMIFDARRNNMAREGSEAEIPVTATSLGYGLVVLVVTGLYFALVLVGGFLLVTPLFLFASAHALGARPWSLTLVYAVSVTALVYLMFFGLGIRLPLGSLFL